MTCRARRAHHGWHRCQLLLIPPCLLHYQSGDQMLTLGLKKKNRLALQLGYLNVYLNATFKIFKTMYDTGPSSG